MGSTAGQNGHASSARCIALVGPYLGGKTTLLEAILARTGTIKRQGSVVDKSTVGDASTEAREHGMSVELNVADVEFLGDHFTFIDCPGSIEFQQEATAALAACDAAVIVCEPDPQARLPALQALFKQLEDQGIPHFLFLNKIDTRRDPGPRRHRRCCSQRAQSRWCCARSRSGKTASPPAIVDLALERAFVYRPHAPSESIEMKPGDLDREKEARFHMLEQLADYDDELMEQLLSDQSPHRDHIFERPGQGTARRSDLPGAARLGATTATASCGC